MVVMYKSIDFKRRRKKFLHQHHNQSLNGEAARAPRITVENEAAVVGLLEQICKERMKGMFTCGEAEQV